MSRALIRLALALRALHDLRLPCHLDRFQLAFTGFLRVVFKIRKLRHVAMQVSDPQRERIGFGVLFREKNSDIVGIIPGEFSWHVSSLLPGVSAVLPSTSLTTARLPANAEPSQLRGRQHSPLRRQC